MQKTLSVVIEDFKKDILYGNQEYTKVIIEHELSKIQKNAFFTKGMTRYRINDEYETLYFFPNDHEYIQLEEKSKRNEKKQKKLLATGQIENEKDAFDLAFKKQQYIKGKQIYNNHTENLFHLWLFNELKKYDKDGIEQDISGNDYLEKGQWWNNLDSFIDGEDLRLFLFWRGYPLPNKIFSNESPRTQEFIDSLGSGIRKKDFSIELMKSFVKKNIPQNLIEHEERYHFYKKNNQWYIAYEKLPEIYLDYKYEGLKVIHYLLEKYLRIKDQIEVKEKKDKIKLELQKVPGADLQTYLGKKSYEKDSNFDQDLISKDVKSDLRKNRDAKRKLEQQLDVAESADDEKKIESLKDAISFLSEEIKRTTTPSGKVKIPLLEGKARRNTNRVLKIAYKQFEKEGYWDLLKHLKKNLDTHGGFLYWPEKNIDWLIGPPTE